VPPHTLTDLAGLRVSAEDLLSAVSDTAAQPIWVVDPDDVIAFVNPAAITALGYDTADDLLGRHRHETIHHKRPDGTRYPAAECPMQLPRIAGQTVARDLDWFLRRDGSRFPVSYVSVPIEMAEGRGAVVLFADIGDRLREEQVLRERDAVLGSRADPVRRIAALVAGVVGLPLVVVWRYARDGKTATVLGASRDGPDPFQPGTRWPLDGAAILTRVLKTGRPARTDDISGLPGTIADAARKTGLRAAAGAPIIVDGDVWGAISGNTDRGPLADHVEERLAQLSELVAMAISNTESQAGLARLAEEQTALRRVATLVARETPPEEVFAAVANEVGRLLSVDIANVIRYESDDTVTLMASAGNRIPVGSRWPIGGTTLAPLVLKTRRPARVDNYVEVTGELADDLRRQGIRSSVATPILVEGRVWGQMVTSSMQEQPLPPDTEARLASFTELVAMAIANTEARTEVARLVDEQAALRRVATLVAEGAAPTAVFDAVAAEIKRLLDAHEVALSRYEAGAEITVVAHRGAGARRLAPGTRLSHEGVNVAALVRRNERPARVAYTEEPQGDIAAIAGSLSVHVSVGAPIVVEARLWGVIQAGWTGEEPPPADTEERMSRFAELLETAIANADSRDLLNASRARLLTEGDEARRRVVRDLHDGAQQRLVHAIIALKLANRAFRRNEAEKAQALVGQALEHAQQGNTELRDLAHGLLPAVLARGGLRASVLAVAARFDLPVQVDVPARRFPAEIERSAYFIMAESLTNVVKHSQAEGAEVKAFVDDGMLHVEVRDDGVGGADPDAHGLIGLRDRATALGGQLDIESPPGGGTLVVATLPLSEGY
jgi:PAS domain S-box-containing protein